MALVHQVRLIALVCVSFTLLPMKAVTQIITTTEAYAITDFRCNLDGTIQFTNPNKSKFLHVHLLEPSDCTGSLSPDRSTITISGCNIFQEHTVALSPYPNLTLITNDEFVERIQCKDVDEAGVTKNLTQLFTPVLEAAEVSSVTPHFALSSALRLDSPNGTEVNAAHLTTPLYWTIDLPVDYYGKPTNCYVYPGTSVLASGGKHLVEDGCTKDADLVLNFDETNSMVVEDKRRYWTTFYTFKFHSSDYLTLWCSVEICLPANQSQCDITCASVGRRAVASQVDNQRHGNTATSVRILELPAVLEPSNSATSLGLRSMEILSLVLGHLLAAILFSIGTN